MQTSEIRSKINNGADNLFGVLHRNIEIRAALCAFFVFYASYLAPKIPDVLKDSLAHPLVKFIMMIFMIFIAFKDFTVALFATFAITITFNIIENYKIEKWANIAAVKTAREKIVENAIYPQRVIAETFTPEPNDLDVPQIAYINNNKDIVSNILRHNGIYDELIINKVLNSIDKLQIEKEADIENYCRSYIAKQATRSRWSTNANK